MCHGERKIKFACKAQIHNSDNILYFCDDTKNNAAVLKSLILAKLFVFCWIIIIEHVLYIQYLMWLRMWGKGNHSTITVN